MTVAPPTWLRHWEFPCWCSLDPPIQACGALGKPPMRSCRIPLTVIPAPATAALCMTNPRCILSITPHQVKQALQRLLKRTQRPGGNRETGAPGLESPEECSPR